MNIFLLFQIIPPEDLQENEVHFTFVNVPDDSPLRQLCFRSGADDSWTLDRIEIDEVDFVWTTAVSILPEQTYCFDIYTGNLFSFWFSVIF